LLGIPHRVLSAASAADDVAWASAELTPHSQPVALLVPPGVFPVHGGGQAHGDGSAAHAATRPAVAGVHGELTPRISLYAASTAAVKQLGDEAVVHANGYPSRESHAVA